MITVHSASRGISDSFYSSLNKLFVLGVFRNFNILKNVQEFSVDSHTQSTYSVPLPKALSKNMLYGKVKLLHAHDAMFLIR